MPNRIHAALLRSVAGATIAAALASAEPVTLSDHVGHTWHNELIRHEMQFPAKGVMPGSLVVQDDTGQVLPHQLTDITTRDDGSLESAAVWFMVDSLPANGSRTWQVTQTDTSPDTPQTDLRIERKDGIYEITTDKVGVRLLAGEQSFSPPVAPNHAPLPLQAVRLRSGAWLGRSWWETEVACAGYRSEILAQGPLFARVRVRVDFVGKRHYEAVYEVIAGQDVVIVEEDFRLGDRRHFVLPDLDERERLLWDWWGGTQGRRESPNNFCFSLYDKAAFKPSIARWYGHHSTDPSRGQPPRNGGAAEYKLDFSADRLDLILNSYLQWGDNESYYYAAWNAEQAGDALAVVAIRPSKWIHTDILPHEPGFLKQHVQTNCMRVRAGTGPDLFLRLPVNAGKRCFLIAALDAKTDLAEKNGDFDRIGELKVKYGSRSLEKVRHWVLDWPDTAEHPRMFCTPGAIGELRQRAESQPDHFKQMQHQPLFRYLATGDDRDALETFNKVRDQLRNACLETLESQRNYRHMYWGIMLHSAACRLDVALHSPAIPKAERQAARALMAYVEYAAWDPDQFPGRENGFAWGTPNQGTIMMTGRAAAARLLADHPMGPTWASDGARFAAYDIQRYLSEDGIPMECPGYTGTGMYPNLVAVMALADQVDMSDVTPRLAKLADFRLNILPPPDVRFGHRTLPTIGDTPYHGDNIIALLGMVLRDTHPELLPACLWDYRASGRHAHGFVDPLLLLDESGDGAPPVDRVGSRAFPGFGAVLRSGTLGDNEPYACYYHGSFSFGHYHTDQGTLLFYAKGAPLMMDFGSQYVPRISAACFHSTLTYDHHETETPRPCPGKGSPDCYYTGKSWYEHDVEPNLCLQYAFDTVAGDASASLGNIVTFSAQPEADYAMGKQRQEYFEWVPYRYDDPDCTTFGTQFDKTNVTPFAWNRQVILVKDEDPMGPNYLFIRDNIPGNTDLDPAFNLWSLTGTPSMNGAPIAGDAAVTGPIALKGQWGIDMDVFLASPAQSRVAVRELAHSNASLNKKAFKELYGRDFEERQTLLRFSAQPGESFTAVVFPRRPAEAPPVFTRIADGAGVRITLPDQTHWVVASRWPVDVVDGDVQFSGTAAVVKRYADGRLKLILPAPGILKVGDELLVSDKPAGKTIAGE